MHILKANGDILLCEYTDNFIVYKDSEEFFITNNKKNAEKSFSDLVSWSEYHNNDR